MPKRTGVSPNPWPGVPLPEATAELHRRGSCRGSRSSSQVVAAGQAVRQASKERRAYPSHAAERRQPSGKDAGNATARDKSGGQSRIRNSVSAAL